MILILRAISLGLLAFLAIPSPVYPLTVEEILALKKAGISEKTIQMLLEREREDRSAGTWKTTDGWVIHSTDIGKRPSGVPEQRQENYPICVNPIIPFNLPQPSGR